MTKRPNEAPELGSSVARKTPIDLPKTHALSNITEEPRLGERTTIFGMKSPMERR